MFRVPRNPCRFIPLVSNGYNEKESQRRTSAQIRKRKAQGAADREDGRSRLLRPAARALPRRAAGLTWAEYARTALSRSVVRQRLTAEQMTLLRQLAGMANNLNQLARKANSAGYVQAAAECTALIEKIDTLIDQINE